MWYLIHAFVGCIIGGYVSSSIFIVILLAAISHFLIDMLPHWDGPFNKKHFEKTGRIKFHKSIYAIETVDFLIAVGIVILMVLKFPYLNSGLMIWGAVASLAPDIIKAGYFSPLKNRKAFMSYLQFHSNIQNEVSWWNGLSFQMIFLSILIIIFHFL